MHLQVQTVEEEPQSERMGPMELQVCRKALAVPGFPEQKVSANSTIILALHEFIKETGRFRNHLTLFTYTWSSMHLIECSNLVHDSLLVKCEYHQFIICVLV